MMIYTPDPFDAEDFLRGLDQLEPVDTIILHANRFRRSFTLGEAIAWPGRKNGAAPTRVIWKGRIILPASTPGTIVEWIGNELLRVGQIFIWDPRSFARNSKTVKDPAAFIREELADMPQRLVRGRWRPRAA